MSASLYQNILNLYFIALKSFWKGSLYFKKVKYFFYETFIPTVTRRVDVNVAKCCQLYWNSVDEKKNILYSIA